MQNHPEIMLFDLGGVLIRNAHFDSLRKLMVFRGSDDELRDLWVNCNAAREFESGRISVSQFAEAIVRQLDLSISPDTFLAEFNTWPQRFYKGSKLFISELRTSFQVGCLSNSNALYWKPYLDDMFDFAYSSHRTGYIKPDREAFSHVISDQRVNPDQIVFFDDAIPNVEMARNVGMFTYHTIGFSEVIAVMQRKYGSRAPQTSLAVKRHSTQC